MRAPVTFVLALLNAIGATFGFVRYETTGDDVTLAISVLNGIAAIMMTCSAFRSGRCE